MASRASYLSDGLYVATSCAEILSGLKKDSYYIEKLVRLLVVTGICYKFRFNRRLSTKYYVQCLSVFFHIILLLTIELRILYSQHNQISLNINNNYVRLPLTPLSLNYIIVPLF